MQYFMMMSLYLNNDLPWRKNVAEFNTTNVQPLHIAAKER